MKRLAAAAALCLFAGSSYGQVTDTAVALCRSIKDSLARLTCYDNLAGKVSPGVASAPVEPKPEQLWQVNESKSPLDDSPQVIAGLPALDGDGGLFLRCRENKTDAFVSPKTYIGSSNDAVKVQFRIGTSGVRESRWGGSVNGRSAFVLSPVQFIRELPNDTKLFVRLFDFRGVPHDSTFELGDVASVRDRIATVCKWPPPAVPTAPKK